LSYGRAAYCHTIIELEGCGHSIVLGNSSWAVKQ